MFGFAFAFSLSVAFIRACGMPHATCHLQLKPSECCAPTYSYDDKHAKQSDRGVCDIRLCICINSTNELITHISTATETNYNFNVSNYKFVLFSLHSVHRTPNAERKHRFIGASRETEELMTIGNIIAQRHQTLHVQLACCV